MFGVTLFGNDRGEDRQTDISDDANAVELQLQCLGDWDVVLLLLGVTVGVVRNIIFGMGVVEVVVVMIMIVMISG